MTHGSLQNLLGGSSNDKPVVGMGATRYGWTDRHPYTVVEVINDKTIVVQEDNYERIDDNGMSEVQQYKFTPNPEGPKYTLTLRANGKWIVKGEGSKNGTKFGVGHRDRYYDFSF